jgi:hypothetical protein
MSMRHWVLGVGAMALVGSGVVVLAQEAQPGQDQAAVEAAPAVRTRLPSAYAQLSDLSSDQKQKLLDVRAKADAAVRAIRAKEEQDMQAVLTDAQRQELVSAEAKLRDTARTQREQERLQQRIQTAQEKLGQMQNKAADEPTTQPSGQN